MRDWRLPSFAPLQPLTSQPVSLTDRSEFPHIHRVPLQVIQAYFEDKGLVRQQLDSFNEFINSSIQEVCALMNPNTALKDERHA